jgi:hypothetical protein
MNENPNARFRRYMLMMIGAALILFLILTAYNAGFWAGAA